MEDSVTENEKLQVLTSMEQEDEKQGGGAAKEVIINGEDDDVVVEEKPPAVGFINQIISNFTPAAAPQQQQEEQDKEGKENDHVEEKPIGLINQIISSFAPGGEEEEMDNKVDVEKQEEDSRGGGGLFTHIMSNLVSSPRSPDEKQAGNAGDDQLLDNAKTPPEKHGNGVIDNIVSNLPTPLPDDAAPASDEASMLIHSIIHD